MFDSSSCLFAKWRSGTLLLGAYAEVPAEYSNQRQGKKKTFKLHGNLLEVRGLRACEERTLLRKTGLVYLRSSILSTKLELPLLTCASLKGAIVQMVFRYHRLDSQFEGLSLLQTRLRIRSPEHLARAL